MLYNHIWLLKEQGWRIRLILFVFICGCGFFSFYSNLESYVFGYFTISRKPCGLSVNRVTPHPPTILQ